MQTSRQIGRGKWVFLSLLAATLLLVTGSSTTAKDPLHKGSKDSSKGSATDDLGPISRLKLDQRRPAALYPRPDFLQIGMPEVGKLTRERMKDPYTLFLNGRAFSSREPIHSQLSDSIKARGLAKALDARSITPQNFKSDMYVVALEADALGREGSRLLDRIRDAGARIVSLIPRDAALAKIDSFGALQAVAKLAGVRSIEPLHPIAKLEPSVGYERYSNPEAASRDTFRLWVALFPNSYFHNEHERNFERFVESSLGATYVYEFDAGPESYSRAIIAEVRPDKVDALLKHPRVANIQTEQEYIPLTTAAPAVVQAGHYLNNLSPFFRAGIDGTGQYVAVTDDGISLDSFAFAHSATQPDLNSANDGTGNIQPDVGATHRKVESYRRVQAINEAAGRTVSATVTPGAGDFLACDAPLSGHSTHGQVVASLVAGNPSDGAQGLGIHRDNVIIGFQGNFQRDIPFDGVARGARLIFQDGHNTPGPNVVCFSLGDTNVNAGSGTSDVGIFSFGVLRALLHDAAYRFDLGGTPTDPATWMPHARGARVHLIPFGVPNFDQDRINGHATYNQDTRDIDDFLYRNRESLVVLAAGNDGNDRNQSIGIGGNSVFPDHTNPQTYQINTPATAKNGLVVGAHNNDNSFFSIADDVENTSDYTSKGPATQGSLRVAPLVLAPGDDVDPDFSGLNFASMVAFRSNDNDQAGPIGGVVDLDGTPTDYLDEYNSGTSFSSAVGAGAATLVRDYFSKGFYPSGLANPARAVPTLSGSLVKAALIASTNFQDLDLGASPGTVASADRFSHVQGYGRIQLVNSLPLSTYPEALLPEPTNNSTAVGLLPTTPLGMLAVDEYFDGGQGFGVIGAGQTRSFTLNVIDGSRELRVALAYVDDPTSLDSQGRLVHDLDLTVVAPAIVDTDRVPDQPTCDPDTSTSCTRLSYNGNMFRGAVSDDNRTAAGPPDTHRCDATLPATEHRDACNPTEAVFLHPSQFVNEDVGLRPGLQGDGDATCEPGEDCFTIQTLLGKPSMNIGPTADGMDFRVTFLGEADGVLNEESSGGLNSAICSRFQSTNADVQTLCAGGGRDFNGNGATDETEDLNSNSRLERINGVPTGTWTVNVFARRYVASGANQVRNAPTTIADTLRVSDTSGQSPATTFMYAADTGPFALVAAGGFLPAGASRAGFDRSVYDCSDSARVRVIDSQTTVLAEDVSDATRVEVRRNGSVVDTETGLHFTPTAGLQGAFQARELPVSRSSSPIPGNGVLDVASGDVLALTYTPASGGSAPSGGQATVDCAPGLVATFFPLFGPDQQAFVVGGCDNDRFFDAGEMVQYAVSLQNIRQDPRTQDDLLVSLTCTNPPGTEASNPCQFIEVMNSPVRVGKLPTSVGLEFLLIFGQAPTFNIRVKPELATANLADSQRIIDLSVSITSTTQDLNITRRDPVVLTFRHALESDVEVFHYSTDYPFGSGQCSVTTTQGCTVNADCPSGQTCNQRFVARDLDRDGAIRTALNPRLSEPGVGPILVLSEASGFFALSELPQETQRFSSLYHRGLAGDGPHNVRDITITGEPLGEEIFDPPFDFDSLGDTARDGFTAFRAPLSRPGPTLPPVSWFHSTSGVCGFQTQQGGRAGVWHAGGNTAGLGFGSACPNYPLPTQADGILGNQFVNDALLTPIIHKVNQARDARGFDFNARLTRFAWNHQVGINDPTGTFHYLFGTIDNNLDLDGNIDLLNLVYGEASIYQWQLQGPVSASNDLLVNSVLQATFGPAHDPDGTTTRANPSVSGDESGIAKALPQADSVVSRFLLPFPATDCNPATPAFDRCPDDRSTQAGPVRNVESTFTEFAPVPGFEDAWGPTGNRFQAALTWFVQESSDNVGGHGWTIDDVVLEWDESHPKSQAADSVNSCSRIGSSEDVNGNGVLDPGEDVGLDGVAGTFDFGEGDGQITRNGVGAQCASLVVDRQMLYDCDTSLSVTVQDTTPPDIFCALGATCVPGSNGTPGGFCRHPLTGRFQSPCDNQVDGFVVVNARTFTEPRGEEFRLLAVPGSTTVFRGDVTVSSVFNSNDPTINNLGNVYIRPASDVGFFTSPLVVSYQDQECDADADSVLQEDNFRDIDGDGVTNFDDNFDNFPDDNCFVNGVDTFNPDQGNDGFGQTVNALAVCRVAADCPGTGNSCICESGAAQCVQRVCALPVRTGVPVGEFVDTDNSLSYTPLEDRFFGPTSPLSFNGVLDGFCRGTTIECDRDADCTGGICDKEDVGDNLVADRDEAILGPDGQPGRAGVDDDGDNLTDGADPEGNEVGWCGSDDRLGDNFRTEVGPDPFNPGLVFPNVCTTGHENDGELSGDIALRPDTFGDMCDNCPLFTNQTQLDDDTDGLGNECEDSDLDDDGFPNPIDNCPTVFNPLQEDDNLNNIGNVCDTANGPAGDPDGDGIRNPQDNCPLVKNGDCTNNPLNGCDQDLDGVLEPNEILQGFQRDSDFDRIGDACDPEDFDIDLETRQRRPDGVPNRLDNCPTIYNPRNAAGVQEDTDSDGKGDSRATGGSAACDPDSADDDNDGVPDDLEQSTFGVAVACTTRVAGNLGAVTLQSVSIDDNEFGDGDGIADPGERIKISATISNGLAVGLTNTRVGLGTTSDSVACVVVGEADFGSIAPGASKTSPVPFDVIITTSDAAQLNPDLPIQVVLREPKRAVFSVSIRANEVSGSLATQTFALNLDLDLDPAGRGQTPFTHFESFENPVENTTADPRDCNGNGVIDCGPDNDCTTIDQACTTCPSPADFDCDEWTLPLTPDPGLRLLHESRTGTPLPAERGRSEVVGAGSLLVCPSDLDLGEPGGVRPDENDWHVHTQATPDIRGKDTTQSGSLPKAKRGDNSLHWGRHIQVPDQPVPTFGDTYCVQCVNAFVMDRRGGLFLNNAATPGQPLRLSFWHIAETCDHECFTFFAQQTSDDIVAVQVRADLDFGGGTSFGAWERIEPNVNPYDGQQDTAYTTPTYEPPDDTNPLSQVDRETTMCTPLFTYVAQGSAKGTDATNCTDGDNNGGNDCGWIGARTNPAERRPDRVARGTPGTEGVWAFTSFDLDRYAGRHIQVRFLATTIDGDDQFFSYLEPAPVSWAPPDSSHDDGWYVDDVQLSGLVPNELVFTIDTVDGKDGISQSCPAPASTVCSLVGLAVSASPSATNAPGTTVNLTAAGSAVGCSIGETQFRWLRNGIEVQPFSTDTTLVDGPQLDTTYTVQARCSSNHACASSTSTTVRVYDGGTSESIVLRWGSATQLSFPAVRQADLAAPGVFPGYEVFCGSVRPNATPPAGCSGTGLVVSATPGLATNYGACFQTDIAQPGTAGTPVPVPVASSVSAPAGNALFFLAGHALPTPVRLGFTSNSRLRSASQICP